MPLTLELDPCGRPARGHAEQETQPALGKPQADQAGGLYRQVLSQGAAVDMPGGHFSNPEVQGRLPGDRTSHQVFKDELSRKQKEEDVPLSEAQRQAGT